jgi:hypothetical protein
MAPRTMALSMPCCRHSFHAFGEVLVGFEPGHHQLAELALFYEMDVVVRESLSWARSVIIIPWVSDAID